MIMLCFWSHRRTYRRSHSYTYMKAFKCCKRSFHDHRSNICTKPAFDYKSIELLLSPDAIFKTARRPSRLRPSSCHDPGHSPPWRVMRRDTGLQQRLVSWESNHTLRVQARRQRRIARLKTTFGQCEAMQSPEQTLSVSFFILSHPQNT